MLLPYLDDYWREHITRRGIETDNLELSAFPSNAPLNSRPDWRPESGPAGADFAQLCRHTLDAFQSRFAICNVLNGAQIMHSEDLSAALCRAINRWIAAEWLDRDPRLRASIVVPVRSPELAAEEIERCAADKRFVQVLMLSHDGDAARPAAELADLSRGGTARPADRHPRRQHASSIRPARPAGPPTTWRITSQQAPGFAGTLNSLVTEGVFVKFPQPESGADRIRRDLAAGLSVAHQQDLARRARRNPVAGPHAVRDHPRACAPDHPAVRRRPDDDRQVRDDPR